MSWYRDYYPRSRPKSVKGGIKSQSKKGSFGESWWAKKWISVLESFDIGSRLQRGRSYARNGQVIDISIEEGSITAKVQGSRPNPYNIKIAITVLKDKEWDIIAREMAGQAIYSAKLLAGEMPQDIEIAFKSADLSMFPHNLKEIKTDCDCPDWSNPCKHIAAVYYLIGEEFDRDPFLIFRLRGIQRESLMELIGKYRNPQDQQKETTSEEIKDSDTLIDIDDEPLDKCLERFWEKGETPENLLEDFTEPPVTAFLIDRLGSPPFWKGDEHFTEIMKRIYPLFTKRGIAIFTGG